MPICDAVLYVPNLMCSLISFNRGGNVLIADLGMLQIKSELQPKDNTLEVTFENNLLIINMDFSHG